MIKGDTIVYIGMIFPAIQKGMVPNPNNRVKGFITGGANFTNHRNRFVYFVGGIM